MTNRKVRPPREEVENLARALAKDSARYAQRLRHYLSGDAHWSSTVPVLREIIREITERNTTTGIKAPTRDLALAFGAKYGIYNRGLRADERLAIKQHTFWSPAQWDLVVAAADKAGLTWQEWLRTRAVHVAEQELRSST